jgi:hypothetical protein
MDYDFVDYFNKHYHTVQKTKKSIKKNLSVRIRRRHFLKKILDFTIAIAFQHRNWMKFGMFHKKGECYFIFVLYYTTF